jgi:SAM-dependent methyltransferase
MTMNKSAIAAGKPARRKVPLLSKLWAAVRPAPPLAPSGAEVIATHLAALPPGEELKVVFGGHWSDNPGWLLLSERDQDVTAPLAFASQTVDVVFAEHVIEHVPFVGGVHFLQEAHRILKPGGRCRILCPMLDRMMHADLGDANGRAYMRNSYSRFFEPEEALLRDLGLDGMHEDARAFMFNNLYMGHDHRFIWTSGLMIKVMHAIGFREAARRAPGDGAHPGDCIERRRRGLYLGYDWREELSTTDPVYDVESFVVEGTK